MFNAEEQAKYRAFKEARRGAADYIVMAVPGICPPILEQNNVYVDGGVLNNAPTDAIRDFGVATAITVDVSFTLEGQARSNGGGNLPNMLELLWPVGTIGSDAGATGVQHDGGVVLKPEVGNIGLFDWNACERAIAAGHQVTIEHLDEIRTALGCVLRSLPPISAGVPPRAARNQKLDRGPPI